MTDQSFAAPTPVGALWVTVRDDEIVGAAFRPKLRAATRAPQHPLLREVRAQLKAYAQHRLRRFDLPLSLTGTAFQLAVWRAVSQLETGELVSYGEIARAVGAPRAHRGVAMAMGRTPLDLFIPAHRVVGSDGRIKGAGPNSMRRKLLAFEGILISG